MAMSSSSKAIQGKTKKRELSDHTITVRNRLHQALSLGIRQIDGKRRRWQCTDAEIQSHALRAMFAFINCMPSAPLQHPQMKESVSDMLLALGEILRSENQRIVGLAVDLTMKLVSTLGRSMHQYHMLEIAISLSCLLLTRKASVGLSCAISLNCILTNLEATTYQNSKEVWEAVMKTNMIDGVICAMQHYEEGIYPTEYFREMACLLKTIIWRCSSLGYCVWSNTKLMEKLQDNCANNDTSSTLRILQLCSSLALCGNGAMKILESNGLLSKIVLSLGTSQPYSVRLEALKLCRHLMVSPKGFSLLINSYCEHIVQGIVCAMGGWRSSCSKNVPTDQMPLVMEACRLALITRWAGNHHSYLWNREIYRILLDNLIGNCCTDYQTQSISFSDELIAKVHDNVTNTRPYIWDILGWLATYCQEDFLPKTKGKLCCLDVLIFCACAVAKDLMFKRRSSFSLDISEGEPVCRVVLMMILSPSKYISSKAKSYLSEMAWPYGDMVLENHLASLKLISTGDISLVSDSVQTAITLLGLACYSNLHEFQKFIVKKKGLQIISCITRRCLDSDAHVSRSSIASHLLNNFGEKTCCLNYVEDWEGGNILLFYSLQALSHLIRFSNLDQYETTSEVHDLISSLKYILNNYSSPGPKCYAAYILSFFGYFGIPSKLQHKMQRLLNENELADLQFILADGRSLRVHGVILFARCPYLLPPRETIEQEIEQNPRKSRHEVHISDRVDYISLIKILEYTYTGFFVVKDDNLMKPLKILANCCGLKSLSNMLQRKLPAWGSACPSWDLTRALKSTENSFFDIILEAKASEGAWDCSICQSSMPHMHAHKIILWANCDYLRALFDSGMHESYSHVIKVPVSWDALGKLVTYFYSGELPTVKKDCIWMNMDATQQLLELQPYVELSSLCEFWLLEEVRNECLNIIVSCLEAGQKVSAQIIHFAAELGQWKIVEVAVSSIAHLYPKMREAGDLEELEEELVEMLRTEYVRYSQKV